MREFLPQRGKGQSRNEKTSKIRKPDGSVCDRPTGLDGGHQAHAVAGSQRESVMSPDA
jgi:hypothetical protein